MNRQLLEPTTIAAPRPEFASGADKTIIPSATARAIIEHGRNRRLQKWSQAEDRSRAAIETMPHVVDALTAMWGYHECSNYLRKLMVIDTQRPNRQGFSRAAFDELVFLYRLVQDNRGSFVKETIPKVQLDELRHRERLMRVEAAYLRRS